MTDVSEVRKLKLHPQAIYTFIKAQAGSLGKALSETVMNSLDAFSKKINIELDASGYVIEDDGQGFTSRAEIDAWFETLGWPHDEAGANHRQFGKFGLGRAQQWAFATNVWHSNQFRMEVDIQNKGLDYNLTELAAPELLGTRIEGVFYHPLSSSQLAIVERELRELVKYVSVPVFFNGQQISTDPAALKWDFETPEAYIKVDESGPLYVYNIGVLVNPFPRYRFKCGGIVVTKPDFALSLNVARNDILEHDCKVWPRIKAQLPEDKAKKSDSDKAARAPEYRQKETAKAVVNGAVTLTRALIDMPELLISVYGRCIGLTDLMSRYSAKVVFVPKGDEFGKRLAKAKLALVVASSVLDVWGCSTPQEFKDLMGKLARRDSAVHEMNLNQLDKSVWTSDGRALFPSFAAGRITKRTSELTPEEKAVEISLHTNARYLTHELHNLMKKEGLKVQGWGYSSIHLGDSPADIAWVSDTGAFTFRAKETVKAMQGGIGSLVPHVLQCLRTAVRELDETRADSLILEAISTSNSLPKFALFAIARYVRECNERDLPLPKKLVSELDTARFD